MSRDKGDRWIFRIFSRSNLRVLKRAPSCCSLILVVVVFFGDTKLPSGSNIIGLYIYIYKKPITFELPTCPWWSKSQQQMRRSNLLRPKIRPWLMFCKFLKRISYYITYQSLIVFWLISKNKPIGRQKLIGKMSSIDAPLYLKYIIIVHQGWHFTIT